MTVAAFVYFPICTRDAWYSLPLRVGGNGWAGVFQIPAYFILWYLVSLVLVRSLAAYQIFTKFFEAGAIIRPLHPDGCGGLSPLGMLSLRLNIAVFVYSFIVGVGLYANQRIYGEKWFGGVSLAIVFAYILGATVMFFLPAHAAFNSMRKAKAVAVEKIDSVFEQLNKEIELRVERKERIGTNLIDEFDALKKVSGEIRAMPTIPYDIKTIRAFVGTILIPIVLILAERLIDRFW